MFFNRAMSDGPDQVVRVPNANGSGWTEVTGTNRVGDRRADIDGDGKVTERDADLFIALIMPNLKGDAESFVGDGDSSVVGEGSRGDGGTGNGGAGNPGLSAVGDGRIEGYLSSTGKWIAPGDPAGAIGKRYSVPAYCVTGAPRPSGSWWTLPQVTVTMGGLDNRIGFAGYWYDPHLKMYHVRHRVYDPVDARWLQRDPIGYAGGWNLYQYCKGDPLGMVDPWGLEQTGTKYHYEINGESSNRTVTVTTTTTRQGWIRSLSFGLFGSPNVTTTSKTYNVDQTIPTLGMTGQEFIRTSDTDKLPAGVSEAQVAWQVTNTIMVNEALNQAQIVAQDTITGAAMSTAVLAGTSLKNIASKAANSAEKAASKFGCGKDGTPRTAKENRNARNKFKANKEEARRDWEK